MKTTIDIADDLLLRAKRAAEKENTTLKSITEEGLRLALERRRTKRATQVRPHVVTGRGAPPDLSWRNLRDLLYGDEGAGGR
ncbi:MAG: hypothetical protein WBD40_15210 [Tepidisphaeraceae bacterium]